VARSVLTRISNKQQQFAHHFIKKASTMKVYFIIVAIAAVSAAGIADDNFGTYLAGNFNYFILKLSSANIYPLYSQSLFSTCF